MIDSDFNFQARSDLVFRSHNKSYENGFLWNPFLDYVRYVPGESWIEEIDWRSLAELSLHQSNGSLTAFEILLEIDFDKYVDKAENWVASCYRENDHDFYSFYNLLALLPKDNAVREYFLGASEFNSILPSDRSLGDSLARRALIRVGDTDFCMYCSEWLENEMSTLKKGYEIEDPIMTIMSEFGVAGLEILKESTLERIKDLVIDLKSREERLIYRALSDSEGQDHPISPLSLDSILVLSWRLGWNDVLADLKKSDWYWAVQFSDFVPDTKNYVLLVWSCIHDAPRENLLSQIGEKLNMGSLDGAIAWKRLAESK